MPKRETIIGVSLTEEDGTVNYIPNIHDLPVRKLVLAARRNRRTPN